MDTSNLRQLHLAAPHLILLPLQIALIEYLQQKYKPSLYRNRHNSIGIANNFELLLKAGVCFDFFEKGFELFF